MSFTTVKGCKGLMVIFGFGAGLLACASDGGMPIGGDPGPVAGNNGNTAGTSGKGGGGGKGGAGGKTKPDASEENGGSGGGNVVIVDAAESDTPTNTPPVDATVDSPASQADGPPAQGGPFTFTGDFEMMGERLCHKKGQTRLTQGPLGTNKSPALMWSGVPAAAKSLAVSLKDRQGGTHWIICNIPTTATGLPGGISMANAPMGSTQTNGWYGPGAGNVRPYEYRLYALKVDKMTCSKAAYPAMLMTNSVEFKEIIAYGNESAGCK